MADRAVVPHGIETRGRSRRLESWSHPYGGGAVRETLVGQLCWSAYRNRPDAVTHRPGSSTGLTGRSALPRVRAALVGPVGELVAQPVDQSHSGTSNLVEQLAAWCSWMRASGG